MNLLLQLALMAGSFFFGEYYGTPAGAGWESPENDCTSLPGPNPDPNQNPMMDWPLIRLESQTGYWFEAPKLGFDYIISGPFHHTIPNYAIDWQVQVFLGYAPANTVFPPTITGTVPVTMWVKPLDMPFMDRQGDSYTYTLHVPDYPELVGVTVYHQVVMWWISPSGQLRLAASRGVKTTIEAR